MATFRDKLMSARCRLITTEPWYGTMASLMRWMKNTATPTMGVRMVRGGEIEALFNEEWADKLDIEELMAVVKHEIEHVVRLHITRSGTDREHKIWNVAADMIVNGTERSPRIENLPKGGIHMVQEIKEESTTEEAYDILAKRGMKLQISCPMCGGTGQVGQGGGQGQQQGQQQGQGQGGGQGQQQQGQGGGQGQQQQGQGGGQGQPCPMCGGQGDGGGSGAGRITVKGTWIDDHSIWQESTVSKDEARQVVKDMTEQASVKACGNVPGHLVEVLKQLDKPIVNWRYVFRQLIGRKAGGKRTTYSRRSRRHNHFGVPGKSSHACVPLNIMVDTSGSMSSKDLELVFTEIEAMSQRFKITLIQFDHGVQGKPAKYHRGDWKKIEIQGRGGTSFTKVLDYIEENKLVADANIILTDGYAPFGPERPYYVLWAIVNKEVKPPWGDHVVITKN
jgi:predicted metal-dependent peptidase